MRKAMHEASLNHGDIHGQEISCDRRYVMSTGNDQVMVKVTRGIDTGTLLQAIRLTTYVQVSTIAKGATAPM